MKLKFRVLLLFCFAYGSVAAYGNDAMVVFSDDYTDTVSSVKNYNGSYWSSQTNSPDIGANPRIQVLESSPVKDEKVLVVLDDQKDINISTWTAAGGWSHLFELTSDAFDGAVSTYTKCFDVAYESLSGDIMTVYAISSATPAYRVSANSWTSQSLVSTSSAQGNVLWVRLESNPNSDEIVLVAQHADRSIQAQVWDGNAWGASLEFEALCASTGTEQSFDISYEQISGDAIVVWNENGVATPHYRVWNGTAWSAEADCDTHGEPVWVRLESKIGSDLMILGTLGSDNDLNAELWNGSSWFGIQEMDTDMTSYTTSRGFDVAYSSMANIGIVVWAQNGSNIPAYRIYNGSSWLAESEALSTGHGVVWVDLESDPFTNDIMLVTSGDTSNEDYVGVQRWDGDSWEDFTSIGQGGGLFEDRAISYDNYASGDVWPPEQITGLTAAHSDQSIINLSWVAPGDDEYSSALASGSKYAIQYSTFSGVLWSTSTAQVLISTDSVSPGVIVSTSMAALTPTKEYWFSVWAMDEANNWSVRSDTTSITVSPFTVSTVDTSGSVGKYTDVAVDNSGNLYVSYYDETNTDLKYAKNDGSWNISTASSSVNDLGKYSSIIIDALGTVHISYREYISGKGYTGAMYAQFNGSSWIHEKLDEQAGAGTYSSIGVDANNIAQIIAKTPTGGDYIDGIGHYARISGQYDSDEWNADGAWPYAGTDGPSDVNFYMSMAIGTDGKANIAYHDLREYLCYMKHTSSKTWAYTTIDTANATGLFPSIAVDGANNPHIAYLDKANDNLKYASFDGVSWNTEDVASAGDSVNSGAEQVFRPIDIALDGAGNPHIVYYHLDNKDLMYAAKSGGNWISYIIDSAGDVGNYCAIAIDADGNIHITYYDETNDDLKYATWASGVGSNKPVTEPTNLSASNIDITSITWDWTDADNELGYNLYKGEKDIIYDDSWDNQNQALRPFTKVTDSGTITANSVSWQETGLSPNTAHRRYIQSVNGGSFENSGTTMYYTLASVPDSSYIVDFSTGHVQLSWSANSNPVYTRYNIIRSSDNFQTSTTTLVAASSFTVTTYIDSNILNDTTLYYKIRAINEDGLYSGYDLTIATLTAILPYETVDANAYSDVSQAGDSSIVLDSSGYPHIAYRQLYGTEYHLGYAKWTGTEFTTTTVATFANSLPNYTTMDLDSSDNPHFAYTDYDVGASHLLLKYAKYNSGWELTTVDEYPSNYSADVGNGADIVVDGDDNIHIAYDDDQYVDALKYAYYNGNQWSTSTVCSKGSGSDIAIDVDGLNQSHILFCDTDSSPQTIRYAKYNGSTWDVVTVDTATACNTLDIKLGKTGNPYLVYSIDCGEGEDVIRYAKWNGSAWEYEDVTSGRYCSIAVDDTGNPQIAYQGTETRAFHAKYNGSSWDLQRIDFDNGAARHTSIAIDSAGYTHFSYYNTANEELRYATWEGDDLKWARRQGPGLGPLVMSPANFRVTDTSETTIDFAWDNVAGEDGFRVYGGTTNPYIELADIGDLSADTLSWQDTGLTPNTEYQRFIQSVKGESFANSGGETKYTLANHPTGSYVISRSSDTVTFGWAANNNPAYTRWGILKSTDNFSIATTTLTSFGDNYTSTTYTDIGLVHDTTYYYKVRAINENNIDSAYDLIFSTITADPGPPSKITGLEAFVNSSSTTIALFWISPGDDASVGDLTAGAGYKIQYSTFAGVVWDTDSAQIEMNIVSSVAPGVQVSTKAYNLNSDKTYWFVVWAKDDQGNWSAVSDTVSQNTGSYFTTEQIFGIAGSYSSIAIEKTDNPYKPKVHVCYTRGTYLWYSKWDGSSWTDGIVDGSPVITVGKYASLKLDSDNNPHIAYYDTTNDRLKYAKYNGVSWDIEIIATSAGQVCSLALDALDNPHITFREGAYIQLISKYDGSWGRWINGSFTAASYYSVSNIWGLSYADNIYTSLQIDPYGYPQVAMRDSADQDLIWAKWNGSNSFSEEVVDSSVSDVGEYADLAVDASGIPHISYSRDTATDALYYASRAGGSWSVSSVHSGNGIGRDTAIALDGNGYPKIAYTDSAAADLELASYNGSTWDLQTVDATGGTYNSAAINELGNVHISYIQGTTVRQAKSIGFMYTPPVFRPENFSNDSVFSSSAAFSWTDVSDEDGYRLMYFSAGKYTVLASSDDISAGDTSYTEEGLTPNTEYNIFLQAVNEGTYANSKAINLQTLAAPPTGSYVVSVSSYSIEFAWFANSNPASTRWGIERSTNNFSTSSEIVNFASANTTIAYTDLAVNPDTTYYYKVKAYNADQEATAFDSIISTKVLSAPPVAPTDFSGTALSTTTVQFSWTDNSSTEIGFRLYSSTDVLIATVGADVVSYEHILAEPNTESNIWKVVAFNDTESVSSELSELKYTLSNPPVSGALDNVGMSYVNISWDANNNPAGTRWEILRSTDNFAASTTTLKVYADNYTTTSYNDSALSADTSYWYKVRAINENQLGSAYGVMLTTCTVPLPAAPTNFEGIVLSSTTINYTWTDNSDNEYGFRIYSATSGLVVEVGTDTVSWQKTGLTANTSCYAYAIVAFQEEESVSAMLPSILFSSANVPGVGVFSNVGGSTIDANWTANGNSDVTEYYVELSTDSSAYSNAVNSGWITNTTHAFISLTANTSYYLRAKARNGNNINTPYVSLGSTTTPVGQPLATDLWTVSTTTIQANWGENGNAAGTKYNIQLSTWNGFTGTVSEVQISTNNYTYTSLTTNTTYWFRVNAEGAGGTSGWTALGSKVTLSNPAGSLSVTELQSASVSLDWTVNSNPAYTRWSILRSEDNFVSTTTIKNYGDNYTETDYSDTELSVNTTYWYKVAAFNDEGIVSDYIMISSKTLDVPYVSEFIEQISAGSPDIVIDEDGTKHAIYTSGPTLRYAKNTGSGWSFEDLDTVDNKQSAKIALGHNGDIHIVFNEYIGSAWQMRYGCYDTDNSTWTFTNITATSIQPDGIKVDGMGYPVIAYHNYSDDNVYVYKYTTSWSSYTAFGASIDDLAFDIAKDGNLHFIYKDSDDSIKYVTGYQGSFSSAETINPYLGSEIDADADSPADLSIAVSAEGVPHVSFFMNVSVSDVIYYAAKYFEKSGGSWSGINLSTSNYDNDEYIDYMSNISLDGDGSPHLAYDHYIDNDSSTTYTLSALSKSGSVWSSYDIESGTSTEVSYLRLVRGVNGKNHIIYTVWDNNQPYLKYAIGDGVIDTANMKAPADFTALTVNATSINWSWANVDGELGFNLYNGTTRPYSLVAGSDTITADTLTYNETGLTPNTLAQRYIQAVNAGTLASSATSYYTLANVPANLAISGRTGDSISLIWNANSNSPATVYGLVRSTDNFASYVWVSSLNDELTAVTFNDSSLENNTSYYYKVLAWNENDIASAYTSILSTMTLSETIAPAALTDLVAQTGVSDGEIILTWTSTGDDGDSGDIVGGAYMIQYATYTPTWDSSSAQVLQSTSTSPGDTMTHILSGLTAGALYNIKVWLKDEIPNISLISNDASAIAQLTPPAAPSGFGGVVVSTTEVAWSWTDNSLTEELFRIKDMYGVILASVAADAVSWTQNSLTPNTSSYIFVEAYNSAGVSSSTAVMKYSFSNVPKNSNVDSQTYANISISWNANNNPSYTRYGILRSTDNFATSTDTIKVYSDAYTSTSYNDTAVTEQTTYYYKVQAFNNNEAATVFDVTISTLTNPLPPVMPSGFSGIAQSATSIQWNWIDNSSRESVYYVKTATSGIVASLLGDTTYWIETGLSANATYYRYVEAYNVSGSSAAAGMSKYTLANFPSEPGIGAVTYNSIDLNWNNNSNPAYTKWGVLRSTDNFETSTDTLKSFSDNYISTDYMDSLLVSETTYYYKVLAYNEEGLESFGITISTLTPPGPPNSPAAFTSETQSSTSIKWLWTDIAKEDGYYVKTATSGIAASLSADTTYWTETGLSVNTTYYRYVEAYNVSGSSAAVGCLEYTFSNAPSAGLITSRTYNSVGLSWSNNSNPAYTRWAVERSTDNFSSDIDVLRDFAAGYTNTAFSDTALNSNTTYYYRIAAYNEEGLLTLYDSVISTRTFHAPPSAVDGFTAVTLSTSAIQWLWQDNCDSETAYKVYSSTGVLVKTLSAGVTYWIENNLLANTEKARYVTVENETAQSAASSTVSRYTFARVPQSTFIVSRSSYSVNLSWTVNSNPAYTVLGILRSEDNFTVSTQTVKTYSDNYTGSSFTDTSLSPETTYYYKINAYNNSGIPTAYDIAVATFTKPAPPAAPANFTGTVFSTTSIKWSWSDSYNSELEFKIYTSTGGLMKVLSENTTFWMEENLEDNSSYMRKITVVNETMESGFSEISSKYTYANSPFGLNKGDISKHAISLSWNGNDCSRFKVNKSTDNISWSSVKTWSDNISGSSLGVDELLPATSYYFAVWGYNGDGVVTVSSTTVSGKTSALTNTTISVDTGGIQSIEKIVNGIPLIIKVDMPAGAVNQDVYIEITVDPVNNPKEADKNKIVDANNKISADNKKQVLEDSLVEFTMYDMFGNNLTESFLQEAALTLSYKDVDNDGLVDGMEPPVEEDMLGIFVLNETNSEWERVTDGGILNKNSNNITVNIKHFSVYALMAISAAANNLDNVIVYPNPYKPGSGSKFDNVDGIIFENLTAKAGIKIFNINGELIFDEEESDGDGQFIWGACNNAGKNVASGIYIYIIYNLENSSENIRGKIAVVK